MKANGTSGGKKAGQPGFALLIVLWSLVLVSFLIARFTTAGRQEVQIAANVSQRAQWQARVDGAIFSAAFNVRDQGGRHWNADGIPHRFDQGKTKLVVSITDEADKINLNTAPPSLLQALLLTMNVDPGRAASLADAIVDWREPGEISRLNGAKSAQYRAAGKSYGPPGVPFRSLDELGLVLGMSPELLAILKPHLTLYSTYGPDPDTPDRVVSHALDKLRSTGTPMLAVDDYKPVDVISIDAVMSDDNDIEAASHAIVKFNQHDEVLKIQILEWQ